jgi:hypothetical protein
MIRFAHEIDCAVNIVIPLDHVDVRTSVGVVRRGERLQNSPQAVDRVPILVSTFCTALMDRRFAVRASRISAIALSDLSRIA